jgi:hypothetical protein
MRFPIEKSEHGSSQETSALVPKFQCINYTYSTYSQFLLHVPVPVVVMPPLAHNIAPDFVVLLRILQNLHIEIHNGHALCTPTQLTQGPYERHSYLA